ncbi:MAG: hypothetical protein ACD_4C00041G0004 [uncultured bacterium (gcode 4)]|uniref:Uncharacterized protein n=1 Tax=uncultured bacterium (gcode 4) TaxID=1234023 RepID=K2F7I8_9BACT|nr:MAG: hypothetical protein ACD_4C00041G0004 [uncultured bacterium (gcode 4)]
MKSLSKTKIISITSLLFLILWYLVYADWGLIWNIFEPSWNWYVIKDISKIKASSSCQNWSILVQTGWIIDCEALQ